MAGRLFALVGTVRRRPAPGVPELTTVQIARVVQLLLGNLPLETALLEAVRDVMVPADDLFHCMEV